MIHTLDVKNEFLNGIIYEIYKNLFKDFLILLDKFGLCRALYGFKQGPCSSLAHFIDIICRIC